jgi:hypothetical protein
MSPRFVCRCLAALAIAVVAGCGGSSSSSTPDGGVIDCASDPRAMTYAPGLSVTSTNKTLKFTLLSSDPAPPSRGNDTWKISIATAAGQQLAGLNNVGVLPFMPDHGHGTSVSPTITANQDGTYTVTPLYLFMPGVWQITFQATPPGGSADTGVFYFCVPG